MNEILIIILYNLTAVALLMSAGWIYSIIKNNVTIADSLWGLCFILITWLTWFQSDGWFYRKTVIAILVTLWGVRLFIHITKRNIGKGEDPRYTEWRKQYGDNFRIVSLFKVFLVQALFSWIIAFSMQAGQLSASPEFITIFDIAGIVIWITGFLIESSADRQLARFLAQPANKGKVMKQGLWRYSRHPNYFGESSMWWGIFVISLSVPWGWATVISPIVITWTLLRITGVTLMEETIFGSNPEYKEYVNKTSSFIPWFPKE